MASSQPVDPKKFAAPDSQYSLLEIVEEFIESVPQEEFEKLPPDGSIQLDHYIYGWPKVE